MDNKGKGKGKGLFGYLRRSRSSSPRDTPEPINVSDDSEGVIRNPGASSARPNPPLPVPPRRIIHNRDGTITTPRKSVRPGTKFQFQMPDHLPQHSPLDEEEPEEEPEEDPDEEPEEEHLDPLTEEPHYTFNTDGSDYGHEGPLSDFGNDDPAPMEVESPTRASREQREERRHRSRTPREEAPVRQDSYAEHVRAAYDYPSEHAMLKDVTRRSRFESYAPPPPVPPPPPHPQVMTPHPYYSSPPFHAYPPVYPSFSPFSPPSSPFAPYPPHMSYPQCPPYLPTYDPHRNSYVGSSSQNPAYDPPRHSSGSYEDPAKWAQLIERVNSMEKERDYYKGRLEEERKKKNKGKGSRD